jgi:hypothetical protein
MDSNSWIGIDEPVGDFDSPPTRPPMERIITNPYSSDSSSDSQRRVSIQSTRAHVQDGTTHYCNHPYEGYITSRSDNYTALVYSYTHGLLQAPFYQGVYNNYRSHAEEYSYEAWRNEAQELILSGECLDVADSLAMEIELARAYANQNVVYESDFSLGPLDVLLVYLKTFFE